MVIMNRKNVAKVRVFILVIILLLSVMAGCGMNDTQSTETSTKTSPMQSLPYDGKYPQPEPYGTGIGAMPGRVVWSHNPDSVGWDGSGYTKGEKIAIKVNIIGSAVFDDDTSGATQMSYTNPVLLKTLLISLVKEGGVSPSDITVYDVSRLFPDYMVKCVPKEN